MTRGASLLHLAEAIMPGDAISHSALAFHRSARDKGFDSRVYARWIDPSMPAQEGRHHALSFRIGIGTDRIRMR
jgi:hypothetical protein